MLTAALLGFVLGLRHAFDPDHVIAVSTIVARHRSAWTASWIGVCWGIGHAATIFAIGFLVIALRVAIPPGFARGWSSASARCSCCSASRTCWPRAAGSFAAGARRVAARGLRALGRDRPGARARRQRAGGAARAGGDAHASAALAYLAVFGVGTIAGMVAFSLALGAPVARLGASAALALGHGGHRHAFAALRRLVCSTSSASPQRCAARSERDGSGVAEKLDAQTVREWGRRYSNWGRWGKRRRARHAQLHHARARARGLRACRAAGA